MENGHGRSGEKAVVRETKIELRRQLRETATRHSAEERGVSSRDICTQLKRLTHWKASRIVLFYMPIGWEPDIWPLAAEALAEGKTVALPRYAGGEDPYHVRQVRDLTQDLEPGQFGILEPRPECEVVDVKLLDLLLVPGLGFAPAGQRLGRGKGYYDRLLAKAHGVRCGVAYDWQVTASIPTEPHDVLVNCIVTPTRCLQISPRGV
jgi:5-formyltetrahydrofolate cyclo-ligase